MFRITRADAAVKGYHPTAADMEFRNSTDTKNPFERARLMRAISHEYLAVLAHDNAKPNSAAEKAMVDAEISRRGFAAARHANQIAIGSLVVAGISLLISIFH